MLAKVAYDFREITAALSSVSTCHPPRLTWGDVGRRVQLYSKTGWLQGILQVLLAKNARVSSTCRGQDAPSQTNHQPGVRGHRRFE